MILMKNKKGFTLVEILAVIVVLVIISVLAINKISDVMKKNNESAVKANALTFIKAVEENASLSRVTGSLTDGIYTTQILNDQGIKLSGTYPDNGHVLLLDGKISEACLAYGKFIALYKDGNIKSVEKGTCEDHKIVRIYTYDYTGDEETLDITLTGNYKLEVWGAEGGEAIGRAGGYGGYSVGSVYLTAGSKLYINVGGTGEDALNSSSANYKKGGYNGGGDSRPDGATAWGAGGGATHIALSGGLLKDVPVNNLLIVAGGGGGGGTYAGSNNKGGNAGGIAGNRGDGGCGGYGATQLAGGDGCGDYRNSGTYGQGANTGGYSSGGGGGYYGGGTGFNSGSGAGGGTGYIGNSLLTNKAMYCYNCTTSNEPDTKTISNTCASEEPQQNCSKRENGYVKITYES